MANIARTFSITLGIFLVLIGILIASLAPALKTKIDGLIASAQNTTATIPQIPHALANTITDTADFVLSLWLLTPLAILATSFIIAGILSATTNPGGTE